MPRSLHAPVHLRAALLGDIAFELVMQTEWAAVLDGALLLRGDVKARLDQLKQGDGAVPRRRLLLVWVSLSAR